MATSLSACASLGPSRSFGFRQPSVSRRLALAARRSLAAVALASVAPFAIAPTARAAEAPQAAVLTPAAAREIALDGYIYGYPLVTMELTRRVMTNVAHPEGTHAPMGQFVRMREYPTSSFRDVTAPNADTLYTSGFIDVGSEPWVLSLPDSHGRYFLFPMLDGWTEVFQVPGKRTTGTGPQTYAITGPNWKGTLPEGVVEYRSPTAIVWLLGRIYCTGTPEDYAAVHRMQDEISLVPLNAYGRPYTPPVGKVDPSIDMKTAVRAQVNALSTEAYFDLLAQLLKDNPPAAADAPMMAKLAQLGVRPGERFALSSLSREVGAALADVPSVGFERIMASFKSAGRIENGWVFTTKTGVYGTDYLQRALITAIGLGANRPQDAVYPTSEVDAEGHPYSGANRYEIRFEKGQFPPVKGFWSLTMYDRDFFFVANPLNRYTLSERNRFRADPDGSVTLHLQHENPGPEKEPNWLPAPAGPFNLMLRLYWPQETPPSILDGSWTIPAVRKVG
ncbi:MAG TPA: DUF1254 domain-containing protein [Phycisphaerales bacterium]|nr:DUF1254 domain-containing protein [Phycisphaerales bacterium]HMP38674.1 DUF1254 domain-containing protein [Phycisphaerales bacterium]